MLTIYNTLTGKKESFQPLVPKAVRMYVCGVTAYDYCHLGHARSALVFDMIRRYLEYSGYTVELVKNFTDIDDKIIKRANEEGVSCEAITTKYIEAYYEDMEKLDVRRASREPKATESMADIIALIEKLVKKELAYPCDGDVYFQVERYPNYGRLSRRQLEDLNAGARVEVDERKRHAMDFALWKSSKSTEPSWESPWGPGRPGWHIECSAMSMKYLGETFDIHGGGLDLVFPHHENEIAQSSGATGKEFVRYWIHNGFVQIDQEKMSKSLGNFNTIREIFKESRWHEAETREVLRYFLLGTHYHSPVEFSDSSLAEAWNGLRGFYDLLVKRLVEKEERTTADKSLMQEIERARIAFREAMDDDFNTPVAIAELQRLKTEVNKLLGQGLSTSARKIAREEFRMLGSILGLFQLDKWTFVGRPTGVRLEPDEDDKLSDEQINQLVEERLEARKMKNFAKADEIRRFLASRGVVVEDKVDGTTRWNR